MSLGIQPQTILNTKDAWNSFIFYSGYSSLKRILEYFPSWLYNVNPLAENIENPVAG